MIISQDQFFLATNVNLIPRAFPFHEFPQSSLLFVLLKSNVLGDRQKIFEKKIQPISYYSRAYLRRGRYASGHFKNLVC